MDQPTEREKEGAGRKKEKVAQPREKNEWVAGFRDLAL
jgi:hypothetical protein